MRDFIEGIEAEFRRYRKLGVGTLAQLDGDGLRARPSAESNSVATLVWHLAGNLESRFTDFLTTDGEKPWRQRDDEFAPRDASSEEVAARWDEGWSVLETALAELGDADLTKTVTIRGVDFTVCEALLRSLAHTAYHVGQMTFAGKIVCGEEWEYLSIAPGGTAAYNRDPTREKG